MSTVSQIQGPFFPSSSPADLAEPFLYSVASAVCQRYIAEILAASLSAINPPLQRLAVDVLTSVARSGFSHPLSISPTLVALTASPDGHLASKAYATLTLLHQKHATLLATRFAEPAKTTHEYLKALAGEEVVKGAFAVRPSLHETLLMPPSRLWWGASRLALWPLVHVRSSLSFSPRIPLTLTVLQAPSRKAQLSTGLPQDALALVRARTRRILQRGTSLPSIAFHHSHLVQDDLSLARFTAEALSSLDLKMQEEPMSVISYLNAALAVSGLQVLHLLEMQTEDGGGLLGGMGTPSGSPSKGASPTKVALMDEGEDGESRTLCFAAW